MRKAQLKKLLVTLKEEKEELERKLEQLREGFNGMYEEKEKCYQEASEHLLKESMYAGMLDEIEMLTRKYNAAITKILAPPVPRK